MVASIVLVAPFTANAEGVSESYPEYVSYQAKRYSESFTQIFGDGTQSYANTYYNIMKDKESVISGIAIWEAAHIATSPTYAFDSGMISKKDMYKIAIFDMLGVSDSNEYADKIFKGLRDYRFWYMISTAKTVCGSKGMTVDELKNFPVTAEYLDFLEKSEKLEKVFKKAGNVKNYLM